MQKPRNWRQAGGSKQTDDPILPKKGRLSKTRQRQLLAGKEETDEQNISPNTVLKWSRMLQASFERVNQNAGKKCVRGVVPEKKLLSTNPWRQFTWIEGTETPIQHFDADELLSILSYLEQKWPKVPVAVIAIKMLLWSCCRKLEVAGLKWVNLRLVEKQVHFEIVGKWGVERWFRIPELLYEQLLMYKTDSPFVFAAYVDQINEVHAGNPGCLKKIRHEFTATNYGRWLYERVKDWAATQPRDMSYLHIFRKTSLQFSHDGEDEVSKRVASDAGVSESVLLSHYVKPKLWRKSNRTFRRLLASLPPTVASRYGYAEDERALLERQLSEATEAGKWLLVAELAARLEQMGREQAG